MARNRPPKDIKAWKAAGADLEQAPPWVLLRGRDDLGVPVPLPAAAAQALVELTATGYYSRTPLKTARDLLLRAIRQEIVAGMLDKGGRRGR